MLQTLDKQRNNDSALVLQISKWRKHFGFKRFNLWHFAMRRVSWESREEIFAWKQETDGWKIPKRRCAKINSFNFIFSLDGGVRCFHQKISNRVWLNFNNFVKVAARSVILFFTWLNLWLSPRQKESVLLCFATEFPSSRNERRKCQEQTVLLPIISRQLLHYDTSLRGFS